MVIASHRWVERVLAAQFALIACLSAPHARAGIPECGDIRLETAGSCELRGDVDCSASCDEIGVYKKACATKLHKVCREECVLDADASCTDSCTEQCSRGCDLGVNVICRHNCFGECVGSCDTYCAGSPEPENCRASCEATCDGECDIKCRPVVSGSCYQHCIECCGGSCTAQSNMTCQTTCQYDSFEQCEYELRADCSASCTASGALFCDGEYVLSGAELPACAAALYALGKTEIDVSGGGDIDVSGGGDIVVGGGGDIVGGGEARGSGKGSVGCHLARPARSGLATSLSAAGALLALGLLGARRRYSRGGK